MRAHKTAAVPGASGSRANKGRIRRLRFLEGSRVFLKPIDESHVTSGYVEGLNDPDVNRFLGVGRVPVTKASVLAYLEKFKKSDRDILLGIFDRKTGRHIGNMTLNQVDWIHRFGDLSIVLWDSRYWGKGYATQAWRLFIDHAFRRLGLHKITAGHVEGNEGIRKVLAKLGFKLEGTLRRQWLLNGEYVDILRYGLLEEGWK